MTADPPPFDGYGALEPLALGPVTTLYCAVQQAVGRKVVIKTLSSGILPDSPFAKNLGREAAILGTLSHPNIVALYDFKGGEKPWLVREWVSGWTVTDLLQQHGPCSSQLAVAIATQVASGLAYAHSGGVVHRAVHPDCVILAKSGICKLTSFSRASSERAPRLPDLLESEASLAATSHLSPEQQLGEAVTPQSDVFAVGVLLFQMLTGTVPPPKWQPALHTVLHGSGAREVGNLIAQCLAQHPSERFADAGALHQALLGLLPDSSTPEQVALLELQRVGLISQANTVQPPIFPFARPARKKLRPGVLALGMLAVLSTLGLLFALISTLENSNKVPSATPRSAQSAEIRVVVNPWARVYVNGALFDVTPFAEAIVLPAGTHQFRFEHPSAAAELRQVSVAPGEAILLDVRMNVTQQRASNAATAAPPPVEPGP